MNFLAHWTQTPAAHALGWTLFHFLWEGVAVAAALAIALLFLRSARLRYVAACLALGAMLLACAATFVRVLPRQAPAPPAPAARRLVSAPAGNLPAPEKPFRAEDLLPWAAPVWLAGVLLLHTRTLAAWIGVRRLRRSAVAAPQPWHDRLASLARAMRLPTPVALLESCAVEVPVVVGYLRPAILMPLGLLAGMPADHLEAILLHELAHIRRRDYLVNLLQTIAQNLLFYHPAVWWISGVIRAERENCCDDLVVALDGNAHHYAVALTALESRRVTGEPALAATGGDLMRRIHRLLDRPARAHTALTPAFSAALVLLAGAVALTAWSPAPQQPAPRQVVAASPYEKWLTEDVAYSISDRERAAFKALPTDEEREHFIEQFWQRRDPTPGTPANEFKEEHYRRIAYANQKFADPAGLPGWKTDRGRVYITYGPPDEIESHPAANPPNEQWLYRHIQGVGENVIIEFADQERNGRYLMTADPSSKPAQQAAVSRSDIWSDAVQRGDMPRQAVMFGTMADNGLIALKPLDDSPKDLRPGLVASAFIHGKHASGRIARAGEEPAIQLDSPPGEVETGVLRAIVTLPPLRNVIHVGRPAGAQPNSAGVVYRLAPDGRSATQTAVMYGEASTNRIQIVSGLAPGDRIILTNMSGYSRFLRIDIR
jgi:GWxTD domain-containing protein